MPVEAYSPDWEEQEYQRLAPQVEAAVNRIFINRGARFGAKDEILGKRLAALRTEIAMDSARKKADLDERKRQEARSERLYNERRNFAQGEQLRREGEARNEQARREMLQERQIRDFQEAQKEQFKKEMRSHFYNENLPDKGLSRFMDWEDFYEGRPSRPRPIDPYSQVKKDWEDRIQGKGESFGPTLPADQEIGRQISENPTTRNRGFYQSYTSPMSFTAPKAMSNYADEGYKSGGRTTGFYDYAPPSMFQMSGDPTFKKVGGPGDITPETFSYWPKKYIRDARDTLSDIGRNYYSGFKSFFGG